MSKESTPAFPLTEEQASVLRDEFAKDWMLMYLNSKDWEGDLTRADIAKMGFQWADAYLGARNG